METVSHAVFGFYDSSMLGWPKKNRGGHEVDVNVPLASPSRFSDDSLLELDRGQIHINTRDSSNLTLQPRIYDFYGTMVCGLGDTFITR